MLEETFDSIEEDADELEDEALEEVDKVTYLSICEPLDSRYLSLRLPHRLGLLASHIIWDLDPKNT